MHWSPKKRFAIFARALALKLMKRLKPILAIEAVKKAPARHVASPA